MTTRLRLLLIEDSPEDAELLLRALSHAGYDVAPERVDSAAALTLALDRQTWDLAISDFTMPGFSGTEALTLLRLRDRDLPFIFVSGTIGEDTAVEAMKAGAHDYIMKGNLKRLLPSIERELREGVMRRERTRAVERLAHLAYHDALTDLPNRVLFNDRLEQAVRSANRERASVALLLLDLDGFKTINDSWGHQCGDRVLQHVATRLVGTLRAVDTVARLGGDEFALLLPFTDASGAELAARKVLHALERPLLMDGRPLIVRASIGIATCPDHGETSDSLLQKADVAMYLAKRDEGSAYARYAPDQSPKTHHRFMLTADVRQGIDAGQFFVEYQPMIDLQTGTVLAVEALARWQHPQQGRLMPIDFIDVAEQTGLVSLLTGFVLEEALTAWPAGIALPPLTVAVNLSPRSLHDPQLPDRIQEVLQAHGTVPSTLAFEITENALMWDLQHSIACLTRLRDMGIRTVIDDFGIGYSSLTSLRQLPVDQLKIDRSFVMGLANSENDDVIVRSTIELAHNLGLSVVAEGVETEAARLRLLNLGCDVAQGFFISEPQSAGMLRQWVARQSQSALLPALPRA